MFMIDDDDDDDDDDSVDEDIFNPINFASCSKNFPQQDRSEQGMLQVPYVGLIVYWNDLLLFFLKAVFWKLYLLPKSGPIKKLRNLI